MLLKLLNNKVFKKILVIIINNDKATVFRRGI